ncbi:P protein [Shanxi Arboretum virus]|uniref:P protein n=1 Tax=Shanxi Arboretum virus TaxID=2951068 RepID=A0AAE9LFW9_9RHAB|nr:MAG: P protein [Almendravirus arboretum]URZ95406.1 P protein [Shanxi Arboretum virus]
MSNSNICDDLFNSRKMLAKINVSAFDISKQISEDYGTTRGTDELNDIEYEENEEKKGLEKIKDTLTGDEIMTPNIFSRMVHTPLEKANFELSEQRNRLIKQTTDQKQVTFDINDQDKPSSSHRSYEDGYMKAICDINNLLLNENFKLEIIRDPEGKLIINKKTSYLMFEESEKTVKSDDSSCSVKTDIELDASVTDSESYGIYPPLYYDLMFGGKVDISVRELLDEVRNSNLGRSDLDTLTQLLDNNLENRNAKDILKFLKYSKKHSKLVYQVARKYKV